MTAPSTNGTPSTVRRFEGAEAGELATQACAVGRVAAEIPCQLALAEGMHEDDQPRRRIVERT